MIALFCALLIGHALGDYSLQGDFLAKAKNRHVAIPGVPWYHAMLAHAAIQAGLVWVITGRGMFAVLEFACHFCIDCWKCDADHETYNINVKATHFDVDQLLHVVCKLVWVLLIRAAF